MSILSSLKNWVVKTWNLFRAKTYDDGSGAATFLDEVARMATLAVESVAKIDLDGDGHIEAKQEILAAAKEDGVRWGQRFLGTAGADFLDSLPAAEIARWLAIARVTTNIIQRFGGDKLPQFRVLSFAVEAAVNLLDI